MAYLTAEEVHGLRSLNGSLQYAAVQSRQDVAARAGMLQSAVGKGEVRHLLEANKVLYDAKADEFSIMSPHDSPHSRRASYLLHVPRCLAFKGQ